MRFCCVVFRVLFVRDCVPCAGSSLLRCSTLCVHVVAHFWMFVDRFSERTPVCHSCVCLITKKNRHPTTPLLHAPYGLHNRWSMICRLRIANDPEPNVQDCVSQVGLITPQTNLRTALLCSAWQCIPDCEETFHRPAWYTPMH